MLGVTFGTTIYHSPSIWFDLAHPNRTMPMHVIFSSNKPNHPSVLQGSSRIYLRDLIEMPFNNMLQRCLVCCVGKMRLMNCNFSPSAIFVNAFLLLVDSLCI